MRRRNIKNILMKARHHQALLPLVLPETPSWLCASFGFSAGMWRPQTATFFWWMKTDNNKLESLTCRQRNGALHKASAHSLTNMSCWRSDNHGRPAVCLRVARRNYHWSHEENKTILAEIWTALAGLDSLFKTLATIGRKKKHASYCFSALQTFGGETIKRRLNTFEY